MTKSESEDDNKEACASKNISGFDPVLLTAPGFVESDRLSSCALPLPGGRCPLTTCTRFETRVKSEVAAPRKISTHSKELVDWELHRHLPSSHTINV